MKKRLFSLLLALLLCLSLAPVAAFAASDETLAEPETEGVEAAAAPVEETKPEQTAMDKVQALIDALPDADTITEESRADVEAQLTAIDEAKFPLGDELDALDFTKYNDAIAALNELDGMGGAEVPAVADETTPESYFSFDKNTGTITGVTDKSLTEIVIPDTIDGVAVTAIGDMAFIACYELESITIPNSVTSIGEHAFEMCTALAKITLPNSVTSIGKEAFSQCEKLTDITIPDGITSIEEGTFYNCTGLKNITIPDSVTSIGVSAFEYCISLESVTIPSSVTSIGDFAFLQCYSLERITIPDRVTSIGVRALVWCKSLTQINVDEENTAYASIDGVLYNKNASEIVAMPAGRSGTFDIPNSVTLIGEDAFFACEKLTNIIIPSSVTTIGEFAFEGCISLTGITIPNSVTSIKKAAFQGCYNLTHITIPNSVTSIESYTFAACYSLTDVYYFGTQEQWNTLSSNIGTDNDAIDGKVRVITYNDSVDLVYDGTEKEVYTSPTDGVTIKYYQGINEVSPINAGTYTAKVGDYEIGTFTITKAEQNAPTGLSGTAETIDGKADGKITGVTSAMEYRRDGDTDYTAIAGTEVTGLADGKYYVRYKADDNHNASTDAEVTIAVGRKLTVTVPTTQVGYTLTVNKTELVWNDSVELTFALANGYSKLDTFAVNVNGDPVTIDANGKYTVTDVQSDITITVAGVADVTAPTISGIENGKTYCKEQTVTVTDDNGIASVTVNGTPVTVDADGKFTLSPAKGTQTVVVTDKADNKTEITVTVNDGHDYESKVTKEATTTSTGTKTYTCKNCGHSYEEEIAKLPSQSTSPKTGDEANVMLWLGLGLSAALTIGYVSTRKKEN